MTHEYKPDLVGTENPHPGQSTDLMAWQELEMFYRPRMAGQVPSPYTGVHLAQITKIERDERSRPTGYATVEILTMVKGSVRASVLMPVMASQHWLVGGLPPINTLCIVGWLPQGIAVILAYYPMVYRKLVEEKGLRDLTPGEVLLQAEVSEDSRQRAGATLLLDKDGSVVVRDKDGMTTIRMTADGDVTVTASNKVTVNCDAVNLGGESGQELVTKDFLTTFATHTHTGVTTGGSTSGPPTTTGSDKHTTKTKAE